MNENKKKILIVEDDEHIARVYEVKFSREGFDVAFATNGEEGVEKAITEKPNLIILDLMLPKKDGFFLLEEVKKNPELAKIPVIVLSNLAQESDKTRTLTLGANEHLVKVNISVQELVDKAKSYL